MLALGTESLVLLGRGFLFAWGETMGYTELVAKAIVVAS
jgi:hypothetical protein